MHAPLGKVLLSFAGGAVLASLADTLMPDAYRECGAWVAFATAAGFLLSFLIAEIWFPSFGAEVPRASWAMGDSWGFAPYSL